MERVHGHDHDHDHGYYHDHDRDHENGHDHDKDPIKLNLSNIKRDINVGFYSRNRIINKESSMSVLG